MMGEAKLRTKLTNGGTTLALTNINLSVGVHPYVVKLTLTNINLSVGVHPYVLPSNINIDVNILTKGSDLLTYQENTTIFKHAFKYIKDSKRFTIV